MIILTWNVNGIRSVLQKGFLGVLNRYQVDIACLQETKAGNEQLLFPEYKQIWNRANKPGYSGTAVFSRVFIEDIRKELPEKEHQGEGRVITIELDQCYIVNVYTPNAQRGLGRLNYRVFWDASFRNYVASLEQHKPVIICGDLNVAHTEQDLKNPKTNNRNPGFTEEERNGFSQLLAMGFVDIYRHLHPNEQGYTWWSYRANARKRNIGWRLDYFCVSKKILSKIKRCEILNNVIGSDHCPVLLEIDMMQ